MHDGAADNDNSRGRHLQALQQWLAAGGALTVWLAAAYLGLTRNHAIGFIGYALLGGVLAWLARPGRRSGYRALPSLVLLLMLYAASGLLSFGPGSMSYLLVLPALSAVLLFQLQGSYGRRRLAGMLIGLALIGLLVDGLASREAIDHGAIALHVLAATGLCALVAVISARLLGDLEARLSSSAESQEESIRSDRLTGLANRVFLQQQIDAEMARAQRSDEALAVVLVDVDGLKAINDAHGQAKGDAVLRTVATTLQRALRPYDHVGRWDGEEFVLVMPRTTALIAATVCQRLRLLIDRAQAAAEGGLPPFTVTFGVANVDVHGERSAAIGGAEAAMRFSKASGPGQVAVQTADGPQITTQL